MSLILETQRLRLKPILTNDRDSLHAILTDRYVRKYLCDDKILSLQQVEEMAIESQKHFEEEKYGRRGTKNILAIFAFNHLLC